MKNIVVALDGSSRAPAVLAEAVRHARAFGARLFLFRAVTRPAELPPEAYSIRPDALIPLLERRARDELTTLAAGTPAELIGGIEVAIAAPWNGIVDAGRAHDADLIVIGSHGYGAIDRLLGTTAAKVVNHADRSVLVVRAR